MQDADIAISGIKLHYLDWNPVSSKSVVLIHGLTANSHEFVKLGDHLSHEGFHVIAPDLRGRGMSSKPAHGYGIAFHAADLISLFDSLSLDKVSIVGHSLGGLIGLYMAALFPERVSKFIMVDIGVRLPSDTLAAISASLNRLGQEFPSLDAYLELCKRMPYFTWNNFWEGFYRYDADVRADGTVISRVPKSAIQEENATNATINAELILPLVRAPTLILRATEGMLGPAKGLLLPREEASRLAVLIKNSQIREIPKTNHYTIVISEDFEREVSSFVQDS